MDLQVPVAPIGGGGRGRGTRGPAVVGLALLVAVGTAVGLSQVFPAQPLRPTNPPPSGAVPSGVPPASADPTVDPLLGEGTPDPARPAAARMSAAQLTAGIADGTLDDWLVYADATLDGRCRSGATTACTPELSIEGLGVDVAYAAAADGLAIPAPPRAILVLKVRGHRLDYLGPLIVDPDGSPSLATLSDRIGGGRTDAARLFDVRGWLVTSPPCITSAAESTPCPPRSPYLADDEPLAGGLIASDRGSAVRLAPDAWGIDRASDTVSEGPFLVRADGPRDVPWTVVARYDPSRSVRVVIP